MDKFAKHQIISLKNHPEYNEKWVQEIISKDPGILNLGDLVLKDTERPQPGGGRLDLLLFDPESNRRYEVEIQLGKLDESHLIRTLEYWDYQRRKFPQYNHCPVIIAEDITSRFLNIISLFNGIIPIIGIQMKAIKIGDSITLFFTTVVDELSLGTVEEDQDTTPSDRSYWLNRCGKEMMIICDKIKEDIEQFALGFELKYNKSYIGLAKDGMPKNFISMIPRKSNVLLNVRIEQNEETSNQLQATDLEILSYDSQWKLYRMKFNADGYEKNRKLFRELFEKAFGEYPF